MKHVLPVVIILSLVLVPTAAAQNVATDDPMITSLWKEAMDSSSLPALAHQLFDVIGPRLVGSPQMIKANEWAVGTYKSWGIEARNEQYGKWRGWERGISHIDLLEPRLRTLEGTMLAWSPSSKRGGTTAGVVIIPDLADSLAFMKWLPSVKGKFVMVSAPALTGRPDKNWEEFALPRSFDSLKAERKRVTDGWTERMRKTGFKRDTLAEVLEQAGAVGVLSSTWSNGWGVNKIFGTKNKLIPVIDLSLEDYNLVYRLCDGGKKPVVRVNAESKFLGEMPAFNTIASIPGTEHPNEYVILSAHFDSWDAGSGTTDNGTGTITMMEAMRILRKYYPNPKRTILAGLWCSEEQGLNGSRAFVKDHPEIVDKTQAVFNQDNGTGRVVSMSGGGLINASGFLANWLSRVPGEVTSNIKFDFPGMPAGGGTDHASFIAAGAPGFGLGSNTWDYFLYTWHTNRDTYDKIVWDDLKNNVVLVACLAYLASEDTQFVPREKRTMPIDITTGKPRPWPPVRDAERAGGLK